MKPVTKKTRLRYVYISYVCETYDTLAVQLAYLHIMYDLIWHKFNYTTREYAAQASKYMRNSILKLEVHAYQDSVNISVFTQTNKTVRRTHIIQLTNTRNSGNYTTTSNILNALTRRVTKLVMQQHSLKDLIKDRYKYTEE